MKSEVTPISASLLSQPYHISGPWQSETVAATTAVAAGTAGTGGAGRVQAADIPIPELHLQLGLQHCLAAELGRGSTLARSSNK